MQYNISASSVQKIISFLSTNPEMLFEIEFAISKPDLAIREWKFTVLKSKFAIREWEVDKIAEAQPLKTELFIFTVFETYHPVNSKLIRKHAKIFSPKGVFHWHAYFS